MISLDRDLLILFDLLKVSNFGFIDFSIVFVSNSTNLYLDLYFFLSSANFGFIYFLAS